MAQDVKKAKVLKIVMSVFTFAMVAFMAWMWITSYQTLTEVALISDKVGDGQSDNMRYYVNEYVVVKNTLIETQAELEETTIELTNTRTELDQVQKFNDQLKGTIKTLERYKDAALSKGEALESMISSFKKKNRDLDRDLQAVRKELAEYQPDIDDLSQGKSKIHLYKSHIRLVKDNMNVIKRKAFIARVEAQKERDRLELLYGNNGYMMKDGESKSVTSFDQRKVDINVEFVNP